MNYKKLSQTDMTVSTIALGCWAFAGDQFWGEQDEADSSATIQAALDAGINFFDTAEGYGNGTSEEVLGRALIGRRDKAIIATKVSDNHLTATAVQQACENSLRRLQTDYIDLYQIHWPSRTTPLAETMTALQKLQETGKVRALGVCNFGPLDLDDLAPFAHMATNQLPYSLLWRAIEFDIQQKCIEADMGILCYSALGQALLTGKYNSPDEVPEGRARTRHFAQDRPLSRHNEAGFETETFATLEHIQAICEQINQPMANVAIAWLLQQPGVTSVIVGARTPKQIRRNIEAVNLDLTADVVAQLNAATDALKQKLGSNPDMWQSNSRFR